jgi:hypothetical protein
VALHDHQRPVEIGRVVGCEAELAARLELGGEEVDRTVIDHPPLGVPRLRPGVGMEQIEEAERLVGDTAQYLKRIALPQANIRKVLVADVAERDRDAVDERFAADEAMVRQHVGAIRKMLARTEADLEVQGALMPFGIAEQAARGHVALGRHFDLGQERVDKVLLPLAQFVPARPAVELVEGRRIAWLVRGHRGSARRLGRLSSRV